MNDLQILTALDDAFRIIHEINRGNACGSFPIWQKLLHAEEHINAQVAAILAEEVAHG